MTGVSRLYLFLSIASNEIYFTNTIIIMADREFRWNKGKVEEIRLLNFEIVYFMFVVFDPEFPFRITKKTKTATPTTIIEKSTIVVMNQAVL